ncbi:MAG: FUN14 domain-containing protein [Candidatus Bathyarchaeota archaeon]|nr:FUN14 domain-containing protein [Candidatus Bathyarchaeota archaeon]
MVEILTPLLTQLGVGGVAGLCTGYALKKIGKLVAVLVGIAFLGLELLAYKGIISINYSALQEWASGLIGQVGEAEGILTLIIGNLPFASSFLVGFALGIKIG